MNIKKLLNSFRFAGEGLVAVFRSEQNFKIETGISILVIALMFFLKTTTTHTIILLMLISSVLTMEILNTILEYLLDINSKRKNKKFKFLKDTMAAAVLINVITAVVIGVIIFIPYFFE
jgi:diacylglycerol kinase